jgi:hypothetical protein
VIRQICAREVVSAAVRWYLRYGLDRDLLVALGGVAWPSVGQSPSNGGHGDGDERWGGVVAGLRGDLEPVVFPSGVALAPPCRPGERGVSGAGLPAAGSREPDDAVGVEREVGDVLAGQGAVRLRRVKGVPAGVQDADQVEQAESGDACLAGLLAQGAVVAPEGELAVLGDGDRVGFRAIPASALGVSRARACCSASVRETVTAAMASARAAVA